MMAERSWPWVMAPNQKPMPSSGSRNCSPTMRRTAYPAMKVTPASEALLEKLQKVNQTLGLPREQVMDPSFGGGGDISFVAPYVPGLVGVGAMGSGAHAEGETVYLDSLPIQAKRMALLMYRLSQEK